MAGKFGGGSGDYAEDAMRANGMEEPRLNPGDIQGGGSRRMTLRIIRRGDDHGGDARVADQWWRGCHSLPSTLRGLGWISVGHLSFLLYDSPQIHHPCGDNPGSISFLRRAHCQLSVPIPLTCTFPIRAP